MIELAYKYIVLNQGKKSPLPVTREKKRHVYPICEATTLSG